MDYFKMVKGSRGIIEWFFCNRITQIRSKSIIIPCNLAPTSPSSYICDLKGMFLFHQFILLLSFSPSTAILTIYSFILCPYIHIHIYSTQVLSTDPKEYVFCPKKQNLIPVVLRQFFLQQTLGDEWCRVFLGERRVGLGIAVAFLYFIGMSNNSLFDSTFTTTKQKTNDSIIIQMMRIFFLI